MTLQELSISTPQGTVKAVLTGAKVVEGRIAGGAVREGWDLTLVAGSLSIASQHRVVIPGKVDEGFCRDWARLQTAEGYRENADLCKQLIERLKASGDT